LLRGTLLFTAVLAIAVAGLGIWARLGPPPRSLGSRNGRLSPCPETPNCVTSNPSSDLEFLRPWPQIGSVEDTRARLLRLSTTEPRVRVMTATSLYIHVESRSRLFRFVDDVEFLIDQDSQVVHFRSASRLGRRDFGVNRDRMASWFRIYVGSS
jgi:uncharacterized protein (DUF1499 family)